MGRGPPRTYRECPPRNGVGARPSWGLCGPSLLSQSRWRHRTSGDSYRAHVPLRERPDPRHPHLPRSRSTRSRRESRRAGLPLATMLAAARGPSPFPQELCIHLRFCGLGGHQPLPTPPAIWVVRRLPKAADEQERSAPHFPFRRELRRHPRRRAEPLDKTAAERLAHRARPSTQRRRTPLACSRGQGQG